MALKYSNADHTTIFDDSRNMSISRSAGNVDYDTIVAEKLTIADYEPPAATWDSVREERDQLLKDTDWQASSDRTMSAGETNYRQALRDLPSTDSDPTQIVFPDAP